MAKLYFVDENSELQNHVDLFYYGLETYVRKQTEQFRESMVRLGYSEAEVREASRVYLSRKFNPDL